MKMYSVFKKVVISGLTLSMVLGGTSAAFADGKGKWDDDHKGNSKQHGPKWQHQGNANIHINIEFDDIVGGDVDWALKDIIKLASKGVFAGYEDGTFRPRQTLTRIEAIAATVNLMGLREEAESKEKMSTELNFKDAQLIEKEYPWAVGYVAVALENDLFIENEEAVQPNKPADRLWATMLLIKALDLEDEARAKMNTQLKFRDADNIPAGAVGYVAVAVEKGLVSGYEDNTFRPNSPVTRAELAALLSRTDQQVPGHDADAIEGTVAAEVSNNKLTILKDGTQQQLPLASNVFIFRDDEKVNASKLEVGDEVFIRTYNNQVVFIEVTKNAEQTEGEFTVIGKLNSISLNSDGNSTISIKQTVNGSEQTVIYNVSPDVVIEGNASLLVKDRLVKLEGEDTTVTKIEIK